MFLWKLCDLVFSWTIWWDYLVLQSVWLSSNYVPVRLLVLAIGVRVFQVRRAGLRCRERQSILIVQLTISEPVRLSLLLRDNFANQSHGIGLLFCWKGNLFIGSKNAYIFNLGGPSYLTGSDLGFVGASCMLKLYSNIVKLYSIWKVFCPALTTWGSFSNPGLRDSWKGEEGSRQAAEGKSSQVTIGKYWEYFTEI